MALNDTFRSILGRDMSNDESDFYGKMINQGYMSPYEVGQRLQATPEYQQALFQRQIPQLQQMLGANDERMMGQAGDALARRFYQQGRNINGSGYTQAYMNSARDLTAQRQNQLANFYSGNFQNQGNIALNQGQGAMQRGYGLQDAYRQRAWDIEDWNRQQAALADMMKTQNRWGMQNAIAGAGLKLGTSVLGSWLGGGMGGGGGKGGMGYAGTGGQAGGFGSQFGGYA